MALLFVKKNFFLPDLSQHAVKTNLHLQKLISEGSKRRSVAATHIHDRSSRSHAIFIIYFLQAHLETNTPSEKMSKVNLVDLAGSERADNSSNSSSKRLKEGANINKSLVTLGTVIKSLAEIGLLSSESSASTGTVRSRNLYIPYRDSALTWLLKDSLGGNSNTIMIATISPTEKQYSETLSTLRYAQRAKNIVNKPTVNEDPNVRLIKELRAEIERLKLLLDCRQNGVCNIFIVYTSSLFLIDHPHVPQDVEGIRQ
ncbi:DgyrCDS2878 [Dimorphilus gyrociliatus]|uniref:Kinesin-like protein n=1 Tax=Dimorphilus gyrociliatus TaxID=2664684 RepID=A0A7I8VBJ8_9ANNE|nr:DgyrCDS2878 [Dimorphilus gyrociliatus]